MQPKPMAETSRVLLPSLRCSMMRVPGGNGEELDRDGNPRRRLPQRVILVAVTGWVTCRRVGVGMAFAVPTLGVSTRARSNTMDLVLVLIILLLLLGGGGGLWWGFGAGWGIGPIGLIILVIIVAVLLGGYRGRRGPPL